ncbi:MAG: serine/threonine-protein kinase [Bacteroidota bacterium]
MIGRTISKFRISEELGRGGMGTVYKAQDEKLDRAVAIKMLPPHLSASDESKARFMQEAKAAAALNHRHILSIYEIDEQDDSMFLVMEYVEGETLRDHIVRMQSGTGVSVDKALDWAEEITRGLKAAHEKGIVHRDIKSENIMVTADGHLKIMDFGLAKLKYGTGVTRPGTSLGTLAYMSPEQAQGVPADHRSNIWSLGVVLYEALTGELPFKAEHEAGLLYLVVNEEPLMPSVLDKNIPRPVDALLSTLLEKNRDKRFQSTDDIISGIEATRSEIASTTVGAKTKAIVVLPFGNISQEEESDYFSDGSLLLLRWRGVSLTCYTW